MFHVLKACFINNTVLRFFGKRNQLLGPQNTFSLSRFFGYYSTSIRQAVHNLKRLRNNIYRVVMVRFTSNTTLRFSCQRNQFFVSPITFRGYLSHFYGFHCKRIHLIVTNQGRIINDILAI
ncbi:LOW QUALITY PROTEIN: hypothetical protein TorRG33x02_285250 [Trema orientale]|uniref:Uncharacterized protein n=1 Tax=Trema orientale TaxID=63057 RepID=A0A2P5CGX5_TREOI|nr:LOW QUALITY PROTEIN: hypothetical protein TorRG33x02_285250 [Trema orientale]